MREVSWNRLSCGCVEGHYMSVRQFRYRSGKFLEAAAAQVMTDSLKENDRIENYKANVVRRPTSHVCHQTSNPGLLATYFGGRQLEFIQSCVFMSQKRGPIVLHIFAVSPYINCGSVQHYEGVNWASLIYFCTALSILFGQSESTDNLANLMA